MQRLGVGRDGPWKLWVSTDCWRVDGGRWHIEHAFEAARQAVGLDDYEVGSAVGWYRHATLVLWSLTLLTTVRAAELDRPHPKKRVRGRTT